MIGDLIPDGNKYWELYLILRQIIGIVTTPKFVEADLFNLKDLVKNHNQQYLEFFGELKPKMHYMVHMAEIMRACGPLVHFWSMYEERKNKE